MKQKEILSNVFVDPELTIICKHCGRLIDQVNLTGFSLICPLCGKPQNGEPHLKLKDDAPAGLPKEIYPDLPKAVYNNISLVNLSLACSKVRS